MSKRLFLEILPLTPWSNYFHEIAILIEIDNEIKAAYHYKVKPDNKPYHLETLEKQGYLVQEIMENPQNFYEVYGSILKLLENYVNPFDEEDFLITYTWSKKSSSIFREFMNENGVRSLNSYLFKFPVIISSLAIDKYSEKLKNCDTLSLDSFNEFLGNKGIKRDALSRVIALYQLYKGVSGVSSN